MAIRKRTIQPMIWQDPDFGILGNIAKLLVIGMITQADDEGRGNAHPLVIKANIFPFGGAEINEIFDALEEIKIKMRNLILYEIENQLFYQFKKWSNHQFLRSDRMQKSTFPAPPSRIKSIISKKENFKAIDKLRKELEEKGIINKTKLI